MQCATTFFSTTKYMHVYNSTTMCIPVQKYKFQYKNKSFGAEKLKRKTGEVGRYFIYRMIITMYLNKCLL